MNTANAIKTVTIDSHPDSRVEITVDSEFGTNEGLLFTLFVEGKKVASYPFPLSDDKDWMQRVANRIIRNPNYYCSMEGYVGLDLG